MNRLFVSFVLVMTFVAQAAAQKSSNQVKLEGQVVCCADCWAEADRHAVEYGTAENLLKAKSCVEAGDPTLLAVAKPDKGGFTLYQLETGKFKLPGKNWLEYVGKRVAVTGAVRSKKQARVVRVDTLNVLAPSPAELEAGKVVGTEVAFTAKDLFGSEQRLSQYKGRIVVLNFWATYCVPCRTEMPDLAIIQNEYAALGLQVIGASVDAAEDLAQVRQFIKETKINFPVLVEATGADMMRFGLGSALPGTVIIGRDGRVAKIISGIIKPDELKKQIDSMLASAEKTAAEEHTEQRREQAASAKARPSEASTVPS